MDSSFMTPAASGGQPASMPAVVTVTPTTGQSVAYNNAAIDQTMNITPAGPLAALTVTLPAEASSYIGQTVAIFTTQTITALTVNGATTIRNNQTTLASGTKIFVRKTAANTWDMWLVA